MDRINLTPVLNGGMPLARDFYWWADKDCYFEFDTVAEKFVQLSERNVLLRLKAEGLNSRVQNGQDISDAHNALLSIQTDRQLDHACALSGWDAGLYSCSGRRILVTESTVLLEADDRPFPHLEKFLKELLGDPGWLNHIGWWKWARMNVNHPQNLPGQIIVYVGKAGAGKSFLQKAITTRLLGGKDCTPYDYMAGNSNFNAELFECQHLIIEDQFFSRGIDARREFGAKMKELSVNAVARCHGKFKTGITLKPKWRTSISLNDERENLGVLPPLDESLLDKVMLYKCGEPVIPYDLGTLSGWKQWDEVVAQELPGLAHFIDTFEMGELTGKRYGVLPWHDASLLDQENETSPEAMLFQIIQHDLPEWENEQTEWSGASMDLERILLGPHMPSRDQTRKILSWPAACGTYMGRLVKQGFTGLGKRTVRGKTVWMIDIEALRAAN